MVEFRTLLQKVLECCNQNVESLEDKGDDGSVEWKLASVNTEGNKNSLMNLSNGHPCNILENNLTSFYP